MKTFIKAIFISILFFTNFIYSQTRREDRITQERTRAWQYESICAESGGSDTSYLIEVTSYVADLKLSLSQAKKNAIHATLFKGIVGNNLGCSQKDPIITNANYEDYFDYFEDFFFNTSQFNQFATAPTGSAELAEKLERKLYKVKYIISVNVDELRKKLEYDQIIKPLGFVEGVQGQKPTIMIFPSDGWLERNSYYTNVENQGVNVFVPDYNSALRDDKLNIAISTLDGMISERGYPTVRLSETLKSINQSSAIDVAIEGRNGGASQTNILEELLSYAKADIIWKVSWTKDSDGIQSWIDYRIDALDSYTNKSVGVEGGTGPRSLSASEGELIRQAVTDKMDAFLSKHQKYFDNIVENGREIQLEIRRFDSFEYYFNDDVSYKNREMEFSTLLQGYLGSIAKDRNFSYSSTANRIDVKDLRIELTQDVEDLFGGGIVSQSLNAQTFAKKISRFIKENFDYSSNITPFGLGKARITIGEK
jgi:hypothetical protein